MSHAVLKLTKTKIDTIKQEYKLYLQEKTPPSSLFVAKLPGCTVTAYSSGKVLFQGKNAEEEANRWGAADSGGKKKATSKKETTPYSAPSNISELSIIGSDEVGTGDFFGPITVVAAFVGKEQMELVKELGVKDSKSLKDPQIIEIAKDLLHTIPYSRLTLNNEKYNELQAKGYNQGKMKAILHNKALHHVIEKVGSERFDGILVDQFCQPGVYFNYLKGQKSVMKENVFFETKGESVHLAVAAASILARYAFIKEMDRLSDKIGIDLPKGAGSLVDETAAKIIVKSGEQTLSKVSKLHFANTKKAKALASKKR
jgi:ribonuclease HIII